MGITTKTQRPAQLKLNNSSLRWWTDLTKTLSRLFLMWHFQSATLKTKYYHLASNLDLAEGLRLDSRLARSAPVAGFGDPRAERHGANVPLWRDFTRRAWRLPVYIKVQISAIYCGSFSTTPSTLHVLQAQSVYVVSGSQGNETLVTAAAVGRSPMECWSLICCLFVLNVCFN